MDTTNPAGPVLDPVIDEFYTARYDEADRLSQDAAGRLERDRTREILRRVLPAAPARVLDIGGGPGVHAAWLAELGYQVTMIEPVARHREQAAAYGTFAVQDGDARALAHPDASADAVLLLGPMYHLVDPAERALALAEAGRLVRPGGLIVAAFINRQAPILDVSARLRINDDDVFAHLRRLRNTGVNDEATGFTVAYFHNPQEILADFAAAGLPQPRLIGVEGPLMAMMLSGLFEDRPDYFAAAVRSAQVSEDHPELLATSAHVLAVVGSAPHGAPESL